MELPHSRLKRSLYFLALLGITLLISLILFFILRFTVSTFWEYSKNELFTDNISLNVKPVKKLIVLISLDGMGSYLIGQDTPYLSSLLAQPQTSSTLDMQTLMQSETMPSHLSMITGLTQEHHGFYANSIDANTPLLTTKTIFDYALNNGYQFTGFVTKDKLLYLFGSNQGDNTISVEDGSSDVLPDIDAQIEPGATKMLSFIHFRDADKYGHLLGWDSLGQRAAVRILDNNLRILINDIEQEFANYQRYIIITADHGGEGLAHGSGCSLCRRIPLLIISENTSEPYILEPKQYNIYDVACVVNDLLEQQEDLNLDCN